MIPNGHHGRSAERHPRCLGLVIDRLPGWHGSVQVDAGYGYAVGQGVVFGQGSDQGIAPGLGVTDLAGSDAQAVIVTPAHQFPLGAVLSPDRRRALVAWARRQDALIIENDYAAEFRYDGPPVGAVQGLAPERTVYIGTTSKTLAPAVRLGWIAAPANITSTLVGTLLAESGGFTGLTGHVFARLLLSGRYERLRSRRYLVSFAWVPPCPLARVGMRHAAADRSREAGHIQGTMDQPGDVASGHAGAGRSRPPCLGRAHSCLKHPGIWDGSC